MTSNDLHQLRRPRSGRLLTGVCAGIAEYAGIDVTAVRLIVAVLTFFGGAGFGLYVLGWLLIPEEGSNRSIAQGVLSR